MTTSWDDGSVWDEKLAQLLTAHSIKGTFYLCKTYPSIGPQLSDEQIRAIAQEHEIGAHTLSHPDLRTLPEDEVFQELKGSKQWLETIVGKKIELFCYPSGLYTPSVIPLVRKAGFVGARTVKWPSVATPKNSFEMETTLPIYPLPFRKLAGGRIWWRKALQPLLERYGAFRKLRVPLWRMTSWESAARAAFDYAYERGEVFHLWGHSWELENYGLWEELDSFLLYVASKKGVSFVTNGELARLVL